MTAQREQPWWVGMEDVLDAPPSTYIADLEARNRTNWARWHATLRADDERDDRDPVDLDHEGIDQWLAQADRDHDIEQVG